MRKSASRFRGIKNDFKKSVPFTLSFVTLRTSRQSAGHIFEQGIFAQGFSPSSRSVSFFSARSISLTGAITFSQLPKRSMR